MTLLIVESPTKARTLSRFLGRDFVVESTMGHLRDLPKSKLGVDVDHDFLPDYVLVKNKSQVMKTLRRQAVKADRILLATDPDREGEAIAWHVYQLLKEDSQFPFKKKQLGRIVFHEITKSAVEQAINHLSDINLQLVDAQQARRVLDRLVGYQLSPLLWKKIRRGLSAGRVQSVAVRLIVDREKERQAFKPEEYWVIGADLQLQARSRLKGALPKAGTGGNASSVFWAELKKKEGKPYQAQNPKDAQNTVSDLQKAVYQVAQVKKRQVKKSAPPPFTTSMLQQRAASQWGWSAKRTMRVAQSLYEQGLITYHRTDSVNLAQKAVAALRNFISQEYAPQYLPDRPNFFKTKSKLAQEAHEAIRPTNVRQAAVVPPGDGLSPQTSDKQLSASRRSPTTDMSQLYHLIWQRFVACQMSPAVWDETRVQISAVQGKTTYTLSVTGRIEKFLGWRKVYVANRPSPTKHQEKSTDTQNTPASPYSKAGPGFRPNPKSSENLLPPLKDQQSLDLVKVTSEQKFTSAPSRYGVASLIKKLEELGIGRPSTYAPIISTIQERQYVELVDKSFAPTPVGVAVTEFLLKNFPQVMDYQFTAGMEENLDQIAQGRKQWVPVIREFHIPFAQKLAHVEKNSARVKIATESTGEKCPECQRGEVVIRVGRFGKFLSCSRFPDCKHTANFIQKLNMPCPQCQKGEVIIKTTKKRRKFFGCSRYPDCKWASWKRPPAPPA